MRTLVFIILVFFQLPFATPAFAEELDSAGLADQALELVSQAKERAQKNAEAFNAQANQLDVLANQAAVEADLLTESGEDEDAKSLEEQADSLAEARDKALADARKEKEQAARLEKTENQLIAARDARQTPDAGEDSAAGLKPGFEHVARPLTGPQGGNVAVDKPNSDGVHFVCDGGQCRSDDGNKAMENAYNKWMAVDPNDTHAVRSVGEIVKDMESVPDGDPVTIAGHGDRTGLMLNSDTSTHLAPGTAEFDQLGEALKGHPATFETCGLANVQGFCSALAQKTGAPVTAYDQKMYSEQDHLYAKDPNTSEHIWRPSGSDLKPGEIVQPSMEIQNGNTYPNVPFVAAQQAPNQYAPLTPSTPMSGSVSISESLASLGPLVAMALGSMSSARSASQGNSQTSEPSQKTSMAAKAPSSDQTHEVPSTQKQAGPQVANADILELARNQAHQSSQIANQGPTQIADSVVRMAQNESNQISNQINSLALQSLEAKGNLNTGGSSVVVRKTPETMGQKFANAKTHQDPLALVFRIWR